MLRKLLLVISVIVVAGFLYLGFSKFKELKKPTTDIYTMIPITSIGVIEISDPKTQWDDLTSNNIIWDELKEFERIQYFSSQIMDLDSSVSGLANSQQTLVNKKIIVSLIINKNKELIPVIQLHAPKHKNIKELFNLFGDLLQGKLTIGNNEVFEIQTKNNVVYGLLIDDILSFSPSKVVLTDISNQIAADTNILDNQAFRAVKKTSSKNTKIKIFVKPNELLDILSPLANQKIQNWISLFPSIGNWMELDLSIKPDDIALNGFITSADSTNEWLSIFKNQQGVKPQIIKHLPNRIAFFTLYGFSNYPLLKENYIEQKAKSGIDYNQQIFSWDTTYGISIDEDFTSWIDNEVAVVISEPDQPNFEDNKMVWVSTTDSRNVFQHLSSIALQVANKKTSSLYSIPFRGHQIIKLDIPDFIYYTVGLDINSVTENYFTRIDDYIVFANSPSILQWTITRIENNKTLSNNPHFQAYSNKIANKSNVFIYSHIAGSPIIYQSLANKQIQQDIYIRSQWLQKFQASSIQVSYENKDLYYVNAFAKYNPVYKKESLSLWELPLDTTSTMKPIIVTNHYTMASEIFIQDLSNTIYLISNKGKVLWKRKINEQIRSKTQQIDVYNNGKLQLIFNTDRQIFIIDRNGNDLDNFPINLNSAASANLSIFDYENNNNYRLIIPLNNGEVRNYNTKGKMVQGWAYSKTNHRLTQPISHITIKNKDYLLSTYDNGSIAVLNRRGEQRIKLTEKFNFKPLGNILIQKGSSLQNSYLMAITEQNEAVKINLSDKKTRLFNLHMNTVNQVTFKDINYDGSVEIIASDSSSYNIYRTDGKNIMSDTTSINPAYPIYFYHFEGKNWMGYVVNNQIFLADFDGQIQKGFPLRGSVPFTMSDINNDGRLNIITIDKNGVMYTYTLDQ